MLAYLLQYVHGSFFTRTQHFMRRQQWILFSHLDNFAQANAAAPIVLFQPIAVNLKTNLFCGGQAHSAFMLKTKFSHFTLVWSLNRSHLCLSSYRVRILQLFLEKNQNRHGKRRLLSVSRSHFQWNAFESESMRSFAARSLFWKPFASVSVIFFPIKL